MDNIYRTVLAPLLLRLGLAFFFIFQGLSKLGPDNGWGTSWHDSLHTVGQVAIAWGELLGGAALAFGFLTRLVAVLVAGILAGSLYAVHGGANFSLRNQAIHFEHTIAVAFACLALSMLGSGPIGLDPWLWRKKS